MFNKEDLTNHLLLNGITIDTAPLAQLFLNFLDVAVATSSSSSGQGSVAPKPDEDMVEVDGSTDEDADPGTDGKRPQKARKKVSAAVAADIKKRRLTKKTGAKGQGAA